jgi:predicted PurR-regulated permease PerM
MKGQHVDRRRLLGVALVAFLLLSAVVLAEVINTVLFAITIAYVLFPLRQWLVGRGYSDRLSTLGVTVGAAFTVFALAIPAVYVVYRRRSALVDLVRSLPDEVPLEIGGYSYVIVTTNAVPALQSFLQSIALSGVSALAVVAFKAMVFALVVYGVLTTPYAVKQAIYGLAPAHYHDIVTAYSERIRATLLGIYVVQAVTALATSVLAFLVFVGLGYDSALTLAVAAGVLQFIPVLGPSVIIAALAVVDLVGGNTPRAVLVLVVGLLVIGFLPDAVLRPRLADFAADLPTTLYFVGFVGGVLTIGVIGFVVGPLVVALLVETVELLSTELDEDRSPALDAGDDPGAAPSEAGNS